MPDRYAAERIAADYERSQQQLAHDAAAARRQLREATILVAALVARLGGAVEVTDMDLAAIEPTTLVTLRTDDGLRLGVQWPGADQAGLAEVVIHEAACPNAPGGAGCPNCACDVAGLAPVDVPGYPGAVTLDGDMITRPWRYR